MPTALTPEVVKEVTERIDLSIQRNARLERCFAAMLGILFVVGLVFLTVGLIYDRWAGIAPGTILELGIIYPVGQLRRLRNENLLFETFPTLLRLADVIHAQELLAQFLGHLIERTKS